MRSRHVVERALDCDAGDVVDDVLVVAVVLATGFPVAVVAGVFQPDAACVEHVLTERDPAHAASVDGVP